MNKRPESLSQQPAEESVVHRLGDFEKLLGMAASPECLCELQKFAIRKTYEPGQSIFWEGDRSEFVYKLLNGATKGYKLLSNGRSQIARFAISGDLLARSRDCTALLTLSAGTLKPGEYRVTLIGSQRSLQWTLQVH